MSDHKFNKAPLSERKKHLMGDHHLQLHPVNTTLNHRGNQIFHASCKVFFNVSTVLPKVCIPHNGLFFPPSLNVLQK